MFRALKQKINMAEEHTGHTENKVEHKAEKKDEGSIKIPKRAFFLVAGFILIFIVGFAFGRLTGNTNGAVVAGGNENGIPSGNGQPVKLSLDGEPSLGNKDAPVQIVEFSDYQCPFCRRAYTQSYSQIKKDYIDTGKVYFVFKDFPLTFHPAAIPAAEYANCANEQGKYWETHDAIYDEQNKLGQGTIEFGETELKKWVSTVPGINMQKLDACVKSGKYKKEIEQDTAEGIAAGVSGTPTFFINGQALVGAQPYSEFQRLIEAELAA
ncbi:MAG: DSBA oxidoreductase [archaeon GW2011_AR6]|nr:MAG: DSBA oxidoreductase [archaeon GW2011_AR6]HIH17999.1 DsbA family protein [Nanoarchaeota archaeon]